MSEGLLLLDKPSGLTSHDVVDAVRRALGVRRVGHTGTLDPMAEGLLAILVGGATRFQQQLQGHDKHYEATIRFGEQTDTGDAMGRVVRQAPVPELSRPQLDEVLSSLIGSMEQVPPSYSAVKVSGRPAYWWARRGQPVTLAARRIHLFEMSLCEQTAQTATIRVHCSSGTYIRVLAETIAQRLGTVGHVSRLIRVGIGPWCLTQARAFSWLREADREEVARALAPLSPAASVRPHVLHARPIRA